MKLKTRTNQPVYYKLPVSSNMQSLSDDLLNSLRVGDVVQKKTGNQKHCYIVSYKEEKHGICLTYCDASVVETISYDYTDGHWVYNSTDVTKLGGLEVIEWDGERTFTDEEVEKLRTAKACVLYNEHYYYTNYCGWYEGDPDDSSLVLTSVVAYDDGLVNGDFYVLQIHYSDSWIGDTYLYSFAEIKGTKLYRHFIVDSASGYVFVLITNSASPIDFSVVNNSQKFKTLLNSLTVVQFYETTHLAPVLYDEDTTLTSVFTDNGNVQTAIYDDLEYDHMTDTVTSL